MEIRVLKYFLTVAETGNITKAANIIHVTQPTLSRQLQDLENELGKKLFKRSSHSVSLTENGIVFKKRASEIMELVEKTEKEFLSTNNEVVGDIFIGSGETRAFTIISNKLKILKDSYPKINFHVVSGDSEDLVERLDKGLLDFCVVIQPFNLSKYNSLNLQAKDTWGILLPKDDALAKKNSIKKDDLLNLPLIISRQVIKKSHEDNLINPVIKWFGDDFNKLNVVGTYNLIYNATIMAENKIGYALALDKLIQNVANSPLTFIPLEPKLEVGINIIWKKSQIFSTPAKLFLEIMEKH